MCGDLEEQMDEATTVEDNETVQQYFDYPETPYLPY